MRTTRLCVTWRVVGLDVPNVRKSSGHFWRLIQEYRRCDRTHLQEGYTITVRMYKVEWKISMRRSTSRWPVSHIGFDTVNTAQRAVGPEDIRSTDRPRAVA